MAKTANAKQTKAASKVTAVNNADAKRTEAATKAAKAAATAKMIVIRKVSGVSKVNYDPKLLPYERACLRLVAPHEILEADRQTDRKDDTDGRAGRRRAPPRAVQSNKQHVYILGQDRFVEDKSKLKVFGKVMDRNRYRQLYNSTKSFLESRFTAASLKTVFQARNEILEGKYGVFSEGYIQFQKHLLNPALKVFQDANDVRKKLLVVTHHYTSEDLDHRDFTKKFMVEIMTGWVIFCIEWIGQGPKAVVYSRTRGFIDFFGDHIMFHYRPDNNEFIHYGKKIHLKYLDWKQLLDKRMYPGVAITKTLQREVPNFDGALTVEKLAKYFDFRYQIGCAYLRLLFLGSDVMESYFVQKNLELELTLVTTYEFEDRSGFVPTFVDKYLDPALHNVLRRYFLLSEANYGQRDHNGIWVRTPRKSRSAISAAVRKLADHGLIGRHATVSLSTRHDDGNIPSFPTSSPNGHRSQASIQTVYIDNRKNAHAEVSARLKVRVQSLRQSLATAENLVPKTNGAFEISNVPANPTDFSFHESYMNVCMAAYVLTELFVKINVPAGCKEEALEFPGKLYNIHIQTFSIGNAISALGICRTFSNDARIQEEWKSDKELAGININLDIKALEDYLAWQRSQPTSSVDDDGSHRSSSPARIWEDAESVQELLVENVDIDAVDRPLSPSCIESRFSATRRDKQFTSVRKMRQGNGPLTLVEFKKTQTCTRVTGLNIQRFPGLGKKGIEINTPDGDDDNRGFGSLYDDLIGVQPKLRALISGFKYWQEHAGDEDMKIMARQAINQIAKEIHRSKLLDKDVQIEDEDVHETIWGQINAIPLPETLEQKALAGCLLSMDNFRLISGLGKGSFGHAFVACMVDEMGDPDLSLIVCIRFEVLTTAMLDTFRAPITDVCAKRHDGIAEVFAYFPVQASYAGKLHSPDTFMILATAQKCGDHTLDRDVCEIHEELSRCNEDDPNKPSLLLWIIGLGLHLSETVAFMHQGKPKVSHRDIKPQNIICCDGDVKPIVERDPRKCQLIDWGLATVLESRPLSDFTCGAGTDACLPPTVGFRCHNHDVWSVNQTMLYVLLTYVPKYNPMGGSHCKETLLEALKKRWGADKTIAPILEKIAVVLCNTGQVAKDGFSCAMPAADALNEWQSLVEWLKTEGIWMA
jgi:serine/threonine protein kinase